jgi:hypothetical protein
VGTELDDPIINAAEESPLFFRGFLFALALATPFWLIVGAIIYLIGH